MTRASRIRLARWYCVAGLAILAALGAAIHALAGAVRPGWIIQATIQLALVAFLARSAARAGPPVLEDAGPADEGPEDDEPDDEESDEEESDEEESDDEESAGVESAEDGPAGVGPGDERPPEDPSGLADDNSADVEPGGVESAGVEPAGGEPAVVESAGVESAGVESAAVVPPEVPSDPGPGDGPLLGRRDAWLLMAAALALDTDRLASGGFGAFGEGLGPGFYPTIWAAFAAMLGLASLLGEGGRMPWRRVAPVYLALALHLILVVLGRDVYSARSQLGVVALWSLIFGAGPWPRILTVALVLAYLPGEGAVARLWDLVPLQEPDWLQPLSGPALALDQALREAAFQSSGAWGLGPEYLSRMDFVAPSLMSLNGLSYLTALAGRGGLMIYGSLVLSVMLVLAWLAVRTRSEVRAASLLPAWLLVASNQYLALVLFLGWRTVGLTHPPAFVAGSGTGLEMLVLAALTLPAASGGSPGRGAERESSTPESGQNGGPPGESATSRSVESVESGESGELDSGESGKPRGSELEAPEPSNPVPAGSSG